MSGVQKKMVTLEVHLPQGVVVQTTADSVFTKRGVGGGTDLLDVFDNFFNSRNRGLREVVKVESTEGLRLVLAVPMDKVGETAKLLREFADELEKG